MVASRKPTPYIVPLRELPTERAHDLSPAFVEDAIKGLAVVVALENAPGAGNGTARARLSLYGDGDNAFARGTISGWFEVACSRCLSAMKVEFDDNVSVSYLPIAQMPDDDSVDEAALAEDEDVFPYDGEQLDLEPLIRERIVLAVPFAPLCRDDCSGLCQKCGINQNDGSCCCETQVVDPRLATLKDFKV